MIGSGGDLIPRTLAVVEEGRRAGLHLGAQLAVTLDGSRLVDLGVGEARVGVPMTPERLIVWFSMTKAVTSVAVAQVWERGLVDLDDPVAEHVPEFAANGKDGVTVRHCLTHTGGFRGADLARGATWAEVIAVVCDARLEPGWVPGETAGYHLTAGMTILAEVVRRVDGRPFDRYVREAVFEPIGMDDCWIGIPAERVEAYGERLGTMHTAGDDGLQPLPKLDAGRSLTIPGPGGGGRGPMGQLVRLYEALLGRGTRNGVRILGPQTVEALTARHRTGRYDKTFAVVNEWGLGLQGRRSRARSRRRRHLQRHGRARRAPGPLLRDLRGAVRGPRPRRAGRAASREDAFAIRVVSRPRP